MLQAATGSRISVLLLTDIVGSTDQKTRLGLGEYAKRLARHDEIVKSLMADYPSAEILKDTGDGYFASFATTSDAVRFALRFQQAMRDEPWTGGEPLRARVGIHVGEVATMELEQTGKPKIVGLAADLVSRVTQLATGGQILLTRFAFNEARQFVSALPPLPPGVPAQREARGRGEGASDDRSAPDRPHGNGQLELKWIAHGPYLFKGTDEAIDVFEVGIDGIAPLAAPAGGENARRAVAAGEDETLGWRPAAGLDVPDRLHWTLEKRVGEGGFGEVWLARHRTLGTGRVFKFCFDADRLRSFKRELTLFRILQDALGDRPDIARLYDVKLDEPPYFLESEYTEGGNLQDWSDMEGGIDTIPLETRLDIVARIADAVSAAHSVGVLHKDIKPSNILISIENDQPRPQLADFGIGIVDRAKVRDQTRPITLTGFTMTGEDSSQTGTRLYIPPEVLVGRPFTVQGDIYALGVLLYQMIVADLNRPLAEGWQREVEDELLREDIAACVDGDPERRLTSAADLAKRLRSLGHRREWKHRAAMEQRAAARRKQLGKLAVGAVATLMMVLVAVGAVAWREWHLRRAAQRLQAAEARQRQIADEVGLFMMGMLSSVRPDTGKGRDVRVVDTLDAAAKQLDERTWEPEVEAFLRHALGQAYRTLGEVPLALPHARRAVELIREVRDENDGDVFEFEGELGMTMYDAGDFDAAERLTRAAAEGARRAKGPEDRTTLNLLNNHVLVLLELNRLEEAEPIVEHLIDAHTRLDGADSIAATEIMNTHAGLLYQQGRYAEAAEAFGRLYEARRKAKGEDHPLTVLAAHNYGSLLYRSGRVDEGIEMLTSVLESQKRQLGPEHPRTLDAMYNLSQMLRAKSDNDGARRLLTEVFEVRTRKLGPEHPDTLHTAGMLGALLASSGNPAEAEPLLRQTLQLQRKMLPAESTDPSTTASALALALEHQDKLDDAAQMYREALDDVIRLRGESHALTLHPKFLLGRCLVKAKRLDEAEPLLLKALAQAQDPVAPNAKSAASLADQLAILYDLREQPDKAVAHRALAAQLRATTQPTTAKSDA